LWSEADGRDMLEVKSSATDSGRSEVRTSINIAKLISHWNKIEAEKCPYYQFCI
jgi:hypothetical protein